ncbi:MAG: replication initiation protein [Cetobacterium sp.]
MKEENKIELLMQSRQLVHTSYEVTAVQNRIFYFCLLNAQKENNGSLKCIVKLEDLKNLIPNKNQRTLSNIKKTLEILSTSLLEFEEKDIRDGDDVECKYTLIAMHKYYKNKEIFEIVFLEELYNHIINYTVYAPLNLEILSRFKSFYSQRLYELLRLWSRTDTEIAKEFKLDQLKFILGVENKYPNYKNFKQRVLTQAVKEINSLGNMRVTIEEIKKSRKVDSIKFYIIDFEKRKYFKKNTSPEPDDSNIIELEPLENENSTNSTEICDYKSNEEKEFYVPCKKLFTAKTLELLKEDFLEYDFREKGNNLILSQSITTTLEKDDEEKIKVKSYNYFKKVLEDKLKSQKSNVIRLNESKPKTKFHNVNQSYSKYKEDELEKMLLENQRNKGMIK